MKKIRFLFCFGLFCVPFLLQAQTPSKTEILNALKMATRYFDEKVDSNGRFVWYYALDFSRRWGELEAYPSMAWMQGQGSIQMGETFLDLFDATKDTFYLNLALKVTHTLVQGQLECGGWHYFVDFAGKESLNRWYKTIGKNGWRLEEFRYYYDNATFDDGVTANATMFLLRMELTHPTAEVRTALTKALNFIKESQYPNGAWPQRYPPRDSLYKLGYPSYPSYYTFNDDVIWNNIVFLITYRKVFGDASLDEPIRRGMNFYLVSQMPAPQAGWSQQYTFDLRPAAARTYEPAGLDPFFTAKHIAVLCKFYEMTGEKKYLARIPEALSWIESVALSKENGVFLLPKFVEVGTNKPLYIHRRGSNTKCGLYYVDYNSINTLGHYRSVRPLNFDAVNLIYQTALKQQSKHSESLYIPGIDSNQNPLVRFKQVRKYLQSTGEPVIEEPLATVNHVNDILAALDSEGRWKTRHAMISNPYLGEPTACDSTTEAYASSYVGDEYDTSPFENPTQEEYLSTIYYISNVHILLDYLQNGK